MMLVADLDLARRLESADAWGNAQCIRAYAHRYPDVGATAAPVAGGYALYAGAGSPLTQAIGLGMNGPVTPEEVQQLEEFYRDRGVAVQVELCPLADPSLRALFDQRGYWVEEQSHVLARPVRPDEPDIATPSGVSIRIPRPDEAELWARTVAAGFADDGEIPPSLLDIFSTYCHLPAATCFLASLDGQPAGGGVVATHQGVAALFSASTRPAFRRRGVQTALLRVRLAFAATAGCDVAMVMTEPGSASQRNAERQGFRVLYTRSKLRRDWPT
jgi:GNAT superfamily N-acetyltransferase